MFERFTEQAREVVVLAMEESRALKHNEIGSEHLLLGMVALKDGVAPTVLAAAGQVFQFSLREAQRLGDTSIDTEHLLLALLRTKEALPDATAQIIGRQWCSRTC